MSSRTRRRRPTDPLVDVLVGGQYPQRRHHGGRPAPFIHESICASMSASALRASKSIFAAMICSRPAQLEDDLQHDVLVPNESKQMLTTKPSPPCEPILDRPLAGSGPPHDPLHGLMAVSQFRPYRSGNDRCVSYVVFSGLGLSRNIVIIISLTPQDPN